MKITRMSTTSKNRDHGGDGSAVSARRVTRWTAVVALVLVADALVSMLHYPGKACGDYRSAGWDVVLLTNFASNALWVPFAVLAVWSSVRWPITVRPWHLVVHAVGLASVIVGRARTPAGPHRRRVARAQRCAGSGSARRECSRGQAGAE